MNNLKKNNKKTNSRSQVRPKRKRLVQKRGLPVAYSSKRRTNKPKQESIPDGFRISHQEYFADKSTTNTFSSTSYVLNPANPLVFPWLSTIAPNFESYVFESVQVIYSPVCPTTSSGAIALVIDFDISDAPPVDRRQMLAYAGAVATQVYTPIVYTCQPSQLHKMKQYFVCVPGSEPQQSDLKTFHVGQLIVATDLGPLLNLTAGELSIKYVVKLLTPQSNPLVSGGTVFATVGDLIGPPNAPVIEVSDAAIGLFGNVDLGSPFALNIITEDIVRTIPVSIINSSSLLNTGYSDIPNPPAYSSHPIAILQTIFPSYAYAYELVAAVYDTATGVSKNLETLNATVQWLLLQENGTPFPASTGFSANYYSSDGSTLYSTLQLFGGGITEVYRIVAILKNAGAVVSFGVSATTVIKYALRIARSRFGAGTVASEAQFSRGIWAAADVNGNGVLDNPGILSMACSYVGGGAMSSADILGTEVYTGPEPRVFPVAVNSFSFNEPGVYIFHVSVSGTVVSAPTVLSHTGGTNALNLALANPGATAAYSRFTVTQTSPGVFTIAVVATTVVGSTVMINARPYNQVIL